MISYRPNYQIVPKMPLIWHTHKNGSLKKLYIWKKIDQPLLPYRFCDRNILFSFHKIYF